MPYSVSSWFVDQLLEHSSRPIRRFCIGTSDYSERVVRWPRFKRKAQEIRDIEVKIDLANEDGAFNLFYDQIYNIPNTCTLELGFGLDPTSHIGSYGPEYPGLSLSSGDAMLRLPNIDISQYVGGNLYVTLTDKNGVTATGFIGDQSQVESLGPELNISSNCTSDPDGSEAGITTGWVTNYDTMDVGSSTQANVGSYCLHVERLSTGTYCVGCPASDFVRGQLYRIDLDIKVISGQVNLASEHGPVWGPYLEVNVTSTDWVTKTFYFTCPESASLVRVGLRGSDNFEAFLDNISYKQVKTIGIDGVQIISGRGGNTQNWEAINSGFVWSAISGLINSYDLTIQGSEQITLYRGHLQDVRYTEKRCQPHMRDKMYNFTRRKVGESDNPVIGSDTNPAKVAWDLCTCYGGLDVTADSSNPDINYELWDEWSTVFSDDAVTIGFNYTGEKIIEALDSLARMTDSAIWIEGDGKINFQRFSVPNSLDATLTRDQFEDIRIDVQSTKLINKQWVFADYAISSDYWQITVFDESSISVSSFGLLEDVLQDETCWFEDSADALVMAQRRTTRYRHPPKRFRVDAGLQGIHRQLAETMRLVDSFYNIGSADGWRILETELDLDKGSIQFTMDNASVLNAFYLDVSTLDHTDLLL